MSSDKAPFFVTLVLAIIGWAVAHIVDRVVTAPTIEFRTSTLHQDGQKILGVTLTNLTADKTFRGLRLVLVSPPGGTIQLMEVFPVEPAFEGDEPATVESNSVRSSASFRFAEIQPEGSLEARASYRGQMPRIRITLDSGTARLVRPSIETWLARHEFGVFCGLVLLGVLLLGATGIWRIVRRATEAHEPNETVMPYTPRLQVGLWPTAMVTIGVLTAQFLRATFRARER